MAEPEIQAKHDKPEIKASSLILSLNLYKCKCLCPGKKKKKNTEVGEAEANYHHIHILKPVDFFFTLLFSFKFMLEKKVLIFDS